MFADIHPDHIDPNTGRPYAGYSSPSIETFTDSESSSAAERRWFRWLKAASAALGLPAGADCDGTESIDGYSLDSAYEAFEAEITPAAYAAGRRA